MPCLLPTLRLDSALRLRLLGPRKLRSHCRFGQRDPLNLMSETYMGPSLCDRQAVRNSGALAFATVAGKTSVSHLSEGTGSRSKLGGSILFKREPSQVAGKTF